MDSWQRDCRLFIYREDEKVEKENIKMVSGCLAAAGYNSRLDARVQMEKIEDCLKKAGITQIETDSEKETILFEIESERYLLNYEIRTLAGLNKILIQQNTVKMDEGKEKLAKWYLERRNGQLSDGVQYNSNTCILEGNVTVRRGWEEEIIRKISNMNRIMIEDYDTLKELEAGKVPEKIRTGIKDEYGEYEREMNYDSHI